MEETIIRKYAKLMQELGLTGVEITECGTVIRLERKTEHCESVPCEDVKSNETVCVSSDTFELRSPMVGMFYSSPAEDAAPFVKVGDTVHKGDILCIIEAMKLMNEIVAEQDGTIVEICAENNQVVDFGHVLFRYRKGQA